MYKWLKTNEMVRRLSDGAYIPCAEGNTDYKAFQEWVALGNTPQAADPPPPPLTPDEHEAICQEALNGGNTAIDMRKLLKAKFISDLAWRLGKAPGALTAAELLAERNRIANIYKTL